MSNRAHLMHCSHPGKAPGAVLIWFIMLLPMVLLLIAFILDMGFQFYQKSHLQLVNDAAALATAPALQQPQQINHIIETILQANGKEVSYDYQLGHWDSAAQQFSTSHQVNAIQLISQQSTSRLFGHWLRHTNAILTAKSIVTMDQQLGQPLSVILR